MQGWVSAPLVTVNIAVYDLSGLCAQEMEKFRENEKEYKMKKMSKSEMINENERKGKFKFGEGSDGSYGDYDDEENKSGSDAGSDGNDSSGQENYDINIDKKFVPMTSQVWTIGCTALSIPEALLGGKCL